MAILVSIDNGGTLTDACVIYGDQVFHAKTLTTPHDLAACFVEVLREASRRIYGEPRLAALLEEVDYIRYSTTQGTNAIVQRQGPRLGLILPQGAKTAQLLRNAEEKELFAVMVGDRVGHIDLALRGDQAETNICAVVNQLISAGANRIVVSLGGASLESDEARVKAATLLRYPRHLLGAVPILYSHQLSDDRDDARRTWSGLLNAYLHPAMERFLYNAENVLREHRTKNPLLIFGNDGTSSRVAKCVALKTCGSGPRGGMEGAKAIARHYGRKRVVTMDIGGTTTDIGVVDSAGVRERRWGQLDSVAISFPLSDIQSLGAGGSSVFRVENGKLLIGPESVGSTPGPACFGRGGRRATITDAYLLMGVLDGDSYFGGKLRLDAERAKAAIQSDVAGPLRLTLEQALSRMERAYQEKIAAAIAPHLGAAADTTLLAFGGAGPLSACGVAEALGIREIIVPRLAAVFSAFGIGFSDIAHGYDASLPQVSTDALQGVLETLTARAERDMYAEGFNLSDCEVEREINFTRNGEEASHRLNGSLKLPAGIGLNDHPRVQVRASKRIPHFALRPLDGETRSAAKATRQRLDLPLFRLEELQAGQHGSGPALIEEEYFTCQVQAGWRFHVNENLDIVLNKDKAGSAKS